MPEGKKQPRPYLAYMQKSLFKMRPFFAYRQKSLFIPGCVQGAIIRAKRVSNCYIQEKN